MVWARVRRKVRRSGPRALLGAVLAGGAGLVVLAMAPGPLTSTLSVVSVIEVVALAALLVGSAIAFGASEPRRSATSIGMEPDQRTASLAERVLASLDGIEHRRVELGRPWPQLSVGPAGVAVVDVCGLEGPLLVDRAGVRRLGERGPCVQCASTVAVGQAAHRILQASGDDVPIRMITVVAPGTEVTVGHDAPADVEVLTADQLAGGLTHGPLLPMCVVDATFARLNGLDVGAELRRG